MRTGSLFLIVFLAWRCSAPVTESTDYLTPEIPATFDSLPPIPAENKLTTARIELGKRLFHETRLSADGKISCGSCHIKAFAYADTTATSIGVHGKKDRRNATGLINVAYQRRLFMEGGVPNLEIQVIAPFGNEKEMDFTLTEGAKVLNSETIYRNMSKKAYGRDSLDGYVISRAIASFERSLLSQGSKYDQFLAGNKSAINAAALRGRDLFFSDKNQCSSCHVGFLFTDQKYHNIGLYQKYNDQGRARLSLDSSDIGKFKTPGLRNVAITAPYMHDGSLEDLEDVIEHYNNGGKEHPTKDKRIETLELSNRDKADLVAFLKTLTDREMP